ncbi:MAG TPA: glycosyltransferase, partial [Polyangium sp.]|nr:glycosyltransferase [Polyangium sp.]
MKILAINHFYLPDQAATSRMLADLCEDLVTFGDEVTVIASQVGYLAGAPRLASDEVIRGVRVQRPWTTGYGKGSLIHRMADSISFIAAAIGAAARQMRPDVILTLTSPPLLGAGAAMVAGARRIPLVLWMQDAFPDAVYETGHIDRYGLAGTTLSAVMKWTLRE